MRWLWFLLLAIPVHLAGCLTCANPETVYVQTQRCTAGYSSTGHCRGWTFGQKPVKQCPSKPRPYKAKEDRRPPKSESHRPLEKNDVRLKLYLEGTRWEGTYTCAQGETRGELYIDYASFSRGYTGVFTFGPTDNGPDLPSGIHSVRIVLDQKWKRDGYVKLRVEPGAWAKQPEGYEMLRWSMDFPLDGTPFMGGPVENEGCQRMRLKRR